MNGWQRPRGTRSPGSRISTPAWFGTIWLTMAALVAIGSVSGWAALRHTAAVSNRLADRIAPARAAAAQLDQAVQQQQFGLRAYLLTGDERVLDAYHEGAGPRRAATERLTTLLAREAPLATEVHQVEALIAQWEHGYAAPVIARQRAAGGPSTDAAAEADRRFAPLRAAVTGLDDQLAAARDRVRADLNSARLWRDRIFAGTLVIFVLTGLSLALVLHLSVTRPLRRLRTAALRVADGDFDHRIEPVGAADLFDLAGRVEAMRQRLASELEASRAAQERLRRSHQELEQFAYVASHDLQEPLRKVASFTQLLQRRYADQLDDRANQYIAFAVDGALRMQALINDVLQFSRVGRVHDQRVPVDLDSALDRARQELSAVLRRSQARITAPPLPTVVGDPVLLALLWHHLLSNAVKFARPGVPPAVDIGIAQDGADWRLTVTDNGIGIDPRYADKIFVIFQRLHPRDTFPGTGVGLAICRKVVEYHGGRIWLDAQYRSGARLHFTLPRTPAPPEGDPARDSSPGLARTAGAAPRQQAEPGGDAPVETGPVPTQAPPPGPHRVPAPGPSAPTG